MRVPLGHHYMVSFRGEQREAIVTSFVEDFDTNSVEIDWIFAGMTPEEHEALAITAEEEAQISEYLVSCESTRLWEDD